MIYKDFIWRLFSAFIDSLVGFFTQKFVFSPFSSPRPTTTAPPKSRLSRSQSRQNLHRRLHEFLCQHYELRYNMLSEQAEFRIRSSNSPWRAVDQRAFNTLTMKAVDEGMGTWSLDMNRLLHSEWLNEYHPLRDYMSNLPDWDGHDRLTPLAQRISHEKNWILGFGVWLRALAAQWMGELHVTANALVPLLVSRQQGLRKSTFARLLMPPVLMPYFSDKFDLTAAAGCEQRLARLGLVNLDEFDRYTPRQMATLKNLLQLRQLTIRRQFTQQLVALPRMASFIGTSNEMELLSDPTGSRRFLCVEITQAIDCSPIEHAQLFAQLRTEVLAGAPTHLTRAEEALIEKSNLRFRHTPPAAEVFWKRFASPHHLQEGELLSATDIFMELQNHYPAAFRGMAPSHFGRILRSLGLPMKRTAKANCYRVMRKRDKKSDSTPARGRKE